MGKAEIGELVRIKRKTDKSVSFFESETSILEPNIILTSSHF